MKNTIKFLFVALAMTAMISCGGGKTESNGSDSTATETPAVDQAPAPDTTATDSTAAPAN